MWNTHRSFCVQSFVRGWRSLVGSADKVCPCGVPLMTSFGDKADAVIVYLDWELKDGAGAVLTVAQRTTAFEEWVSRMLVKSLKWEKSDADTWVTAVIKPNSLTCCSELLDALNTDHVPRSTWVTTYTSTKLKLRDNATLNILHTLVKAEIKSLGNTASRTAEGHVTGSHTGDATQLLMALALGSKTGSKFGMNMSAFPGLAQSVAETKRVRREQLRQALKKTGLEQLFDEVLPGEQVMMAVDNGLASGNEHVAISINDLVELFDEWTPESDTGIGGDSEESAQNKSKPPKGEAWGLSHHLLKLLVFMVALRLRDQVDEAHVYNMLYFVLKHYRSEGNKEVGMHYAQSLFNRLHKKSWWKSQGTLKEALQNVNKDVLESLRLKYPKVDKSSSKGAAQGKGSLGGGKGAKPFYGKGDRSSSGKGAFGGQSGASSWDRTPVRSRSRSRGRAGKDRKGDKDGKGKKEFGGKGDKDGGKSGGKNSDPRVQKAFQLSKEGQKYCPFWQIGNCRFGKDCKFFNECYLCRSDRHGANKCPNLSSGDAGRRLGM